jgi:hypoxanthine phosphoribosyltransferase
VKGEKRMKTPAKQTVLLSAAAIRRRVAELAAGIAARIGTGKGWQIIAVLDGSFVFLADLMRQLSLRRIPLQLDFIALSSYGAGTRSTGRIRLRSDPTLSVRGKDVLLVDDILDTGLTLRYARDRLLQKGARQVLTCVLLEKRVPRRIAIAPDFVGFPIPDVFVVGYGLDYRHRFRELPYIARFSESVSLKRAE